MNVEQKWKKIQKTVYSSYILIATTLFGVCAYISYRLSSLEIGTFLPLLLLIIYLLLERYRAKKYEKSVIYIFLGTILLFILELGKIIKNNFLITPFFLIYLYLLLPLFVAYKREENPKSKMLAIAKIIFFVTLFFILLYLVHIYGAD